MRYTLSARDWLKGFILAVVIPALLTIQQSLAAGELTINWQQIGMSALATLIAYLVKNFVTDDVKVAEKTLDEADKRAAAKTV